MEPKHTDISTLIGILVTILLIFGAIMLGNSGISSFLDVKSFMIVILGTLFLVSACFSIKDVWQAKSIIAQTTYYSSEDPEDAAMHALKIADLARKDGVLSLLKHKKEIERNHFLKRNLLMIIDGFPIEDTEKMTNREIAATDERHHKSVEILKKAAEISPAMGLIGTLIGLVQMLANLDDPASIGPAMAVALLTTLYGAMLAYMVFTPLATKLEKNSEDEMLVMQIYMQTVLSIGRKENPRRLQMMVNSLLPPAKRIHYFD